MVDTPPGKSTSQASCWRRPQLRLHQQTHIIEILGRKRPFRVFSPVGRQCRLDHLANALQASFDEADRGLTDAGGAAMGFQGVDRVEQAAKRIVDLVRHAGGQATKARQLFLGCELHGEVGAFVLGAHQCIEAPKRLAVSLSRDGKAAVGMG